LNNTENYRLDALVNNAALGWQDGSLAKRYALAFATNATGPLLVTDAFEPLLSKSLHTPRIINVSSGGGSITKRLDATTSTSKVGFWGLPYCASKAALNLITATQATVYGTRSLDSEETDLSKSGARGKAFKVFAYTPGFTISNLGPHNNAESGASPTSEGAAPMIKILNGERDDEHACFLSKDGQYPW
jgi:NAD(P)-dependent dehydrogenase (short-subunit alcohol dehydrogenase family)